MAEMYIVDALYALNEPWRDRFLVFSFSILERIVGIETCMLSLQTPRRCSPFQYPRTDRWH